MDQVTEIKQATSDWNQIRWDAQYVKQLLEDGSFFTITRDDYLKWKNQDKLPEMIHAYPGVFYDELKFVLIDSNTDKKTFDESSLDFTVIKDYSDDYGVGGNDFIDNAVSGNIEVDEALRRVLRWNVMRESWIYDQIFSFDDNQVGIFRVFNIPFLSLSEVFENLSVDEFIVNFGLKPRVDPKPGESRYVADLLLWSNYTTRGDDDPPVQNLVAPCPPFGQNPEDEYNVINP